MHAAILFVMGLVTALAIYLILDLPSPQPAAGGTSVHVPSQDGAVRPSSRIYALIAGKLISASGADYQFPADAPAVGLKYYAIYYSAAWCQPSHAFTPTLVNWYNSFKPAHHNFEVIFVSDDRDEASMLQYMRETSMPWPALKYEFITNDRTGIDQYAGEGIPDLVMVDSDGNLLADSYQNGVYVGPQSAIDDIERILGGSTP